MKHRNLKVIGLAMAALALSACSFSPIPSPPAKTWVNGPCSKETPGVTLSTDYLGKVTTHCALDFNGDGWNLFRAAGFQVKGTAKYPTSFACQIDGEPSTATCDDTATAGAYWGYYVDTKGLWGYATTGAGDHQSQCGTSEGWVYMETEKTVSHLPAPVEFTCN